MRPQSQSDHECKLAMEIEQDGHLINRHVAEAALCPHSEFGSVLAGGDNATFGSFQPIGEVNETEVEFRARRQTQVDERLEISILVARDWHGHVDPGQQALQLRNDGIAERNEVAQIARFDHMLAAQKNLEAGIGRIQNTGTQFPT